MPKIVGYGGKDVTEGSFSSPSTSSIQGALGGLVTRAVSKGAGLARKIGRKVERRERLSPPRNILGRRG